MAMGIKLCPMCGGRPTNSVFARLRNPPCDFCGGGGKVDTELVCSCGRPAVRKTNGKDHCTRFECGKAALEQK